jgi:hypothetical protein
MPVDPLAQVAGGGLRRLEAYDRSFAGVAPGDMAHHAGNQALEDGDCERAAGEFETPWPSIRTTSALCAASPGACISAAAMPRRSCGRWGDRAGRSSRRTTATSRRQRRLRQPRHPARQHGPHEGALADYDEALRSIARSPRDRIG